MVKTYTKTRITDEPRLVIRHDTDGMSPREDSNLGYFITNDRNYHSPDRNERLERIVATTGDEADNRDHHMELITKAIETETDEKVLAIYPIVKYEHGGVSYRRGTAHGFDYSNNGFYIITDKTQSEVGTPAERLEHLRGEIEAERISYGEIAELQSLAEFIEPGDVLLLEWAGVPEFTN